jgi:hypothetical protein
VGAVVGHFGVCAPSFLSLPTMVDINDFWDTVHCVYNTHLSNSRDVLRLVRDVRAMYPCEVVMTHADNLLTVIRFHMMSGGAAACHVIRVPFCVDFDEALDEDKKEEAAEKDDL